MVLSMKILNLVLAKSGEHRTERITIGIKRDARECFFPINPLEREMLVEIELHVLHRGRFDLAAENSLDEEALAFLKRKLGADQSRRFFERKRVFLAALALGRFDERLPLFAPAGDGLPEAASLGPHLQ